MVLHQCTLLLKYFWLKQKHQMILIYFYLLHFRVGSRLITLKIAFFKVVVRLHSCDQTALWSRVWYSLKAPGLFLDAYWLTTFSFCHWRLFPGWLGQVILVLSFFDWRKGFLRCVFASELPWVWICCGGKYCVNQQLFNICNTYRWFLTLEEQNETRLMNTNGARFFSSFFLRPWGTL